jgi:hypothetical protein
MLCNMHSGHFDRESRKPNPNPIDNTVVTTARKRNDRGIHGGELAKRIQVDQL